MSSRTAKTFILLLLSTTLSYLLLSWLASVQIDPIRRFYSPEPEFRQHGEPVFHPAGAVLWLQVLAIYSAFSALLTARLWQLPRRMVFRLALMLFLTASAYVTVCHPLLLPVLLSGAWWEHYSALAVRLPMLEEIYYHFGLPRLKYIVLSGQALLTTAICFLMIGLSRRQMRRTAS